ncbi:phage protease [Chryseosolibacter indicus]|uniref:Uncharacterized protein n=1 Tax=Chryseosolibacter indicus TaxID=2782351 RepID=A0ABS5VQ26_9BACT|nr:phage protease [Chryseosolibacter indicus]MBT1702950.1 hypothetical protein [Chryseosolibacter indicus]
MSKFKKIDKEFVLTDSSVNCYGFRLLTSGYLIDEYKKNPIGYAMHKRDDGVLVRWEDLRLEGDTVYAKPVINLSHIHGQRTVDEIENGFLNAASVGHIVVLETSEEASLKLDGQTGPTITKWYNRECSLVDVPGNYNALKQLYDSDDQLINNLSDFSKTKFQNDNMNKIFFTGTQLSAMNLRAEANETEVATAFNDLVAKAAKADGLQKQLNDLHAQVSTDKVKGILSAALAANKITKELSDKLEIDYKNNPDGLKNLVDAMPAYKPVVDSLKDSADGKAKRIADLSAKSFDDLMSTGESAELQKLAPEVWAAKVKELEK